MVAVLRRRRFQDCCGGGEAVGIFIYNIYLMYFLDTLKFRNESLYYFGWACLVASLIFSILIKTTSIQVMGVNVWYKPLKFALSTVLFSWAMGWYAHYLGSSINVKAYNWTVIILLGFEIVYIAFQANRGQLSHYNLSTPVYSFLYSMMALAATAVTLYTGYLGLLFFKNDFPDLPIYYLWAIRLGIMIFVVFSLEGFVMGSRLTHTIGGPDGGPGLPLLNWSTKYGDPRIAHFIGMHALQVLPILSYYLLRSVKLTFFAGLMYCFLAAFALFQALQGRPFFTR